MTERYTIRKPHFKMINARGDVICLLQRRGGANDSLMTNRYENFKLAERARAIGSCAYHLCGHGKGVEATDARAVETMQGAYVFMFGPDVEIPVRCEIVA